MKTTKKLMKKTVLFTLLALLGMTQMAAQGYEYVPFVREGVKWVYFYNNFDDPYPANPNFALGKVYLKLEFKGDTVINGKTYKAMHKYYGSAINPENDTVPICMREENKVVYAIVPDGKTYLDCPIGNCATYQDYDAIRNGQEFVLYDFSSEEACWKNLMNSTYEDQFTTDVIPIGDHQAKRYSCEDSFFKVIEGIGIDSPTSYTLSFFMPMLIGDGSVTFGLSHVVEDGKIIYKGELYEETEPEGYEYVPFVREGVKWVYRVQIQDEYIDDDDVGHVSYENHYYNLEFKGDTVINGKVYKAMHMYSGDAINEENDTIPVYMREEDKIVYAIVPDGKFYDICPIGIGDNSEVDSSLQNGEEFILYDFNDPVTFCYNNLWYYKYYVDNGGNPYKFTDMITVNGHKAKRYVFCCRDEYCFVEGIGYDGIRYGYTLAYLYDFFPNTPVTYHLSHVIEDGKIIYRSEGEINNDPDDLYLPIARSDVKWVNERVIVKDGVTTSYYYTYTFKPVEYAGGRYYCYYASENLTNPCTDSIVSTNVETILGFVCENNLMLKPYQNNGGNMIDFEHYGGLILYSFDKSDISSYCMLNYYIEHQKEDLLNRENFVQVDPLTIEGVTCSRYAYISDQGDTLCYVVEGIGIDSYDMGDLLTPFTRKPDPDADYQEYCGLSHVIKDGKIIYKGMRYHPNLSGDVNSDGEITIADANNVVDIIVMGDNSTHSRAPQADVNGDGEVNIADVNAIIDIIQSNNQR